MYWEDTPSSQIVVPGVDYVIWNESFKDRQTKLVGTPTGFKIEWKVEKWKPVNSHLLGPNI